jgi:hypothetical protein
VITRAVVQSSTVRYSTVDDTRDTEVVRVRLRTSGLSKLNLVCSKTRGYAIARRDFRSWTRATRNLHDLLYKDRCSGNSKVNLVCGKVRGNRKLCSRETRLSILGTRDTKKIGLMFGHFESECSIQQNACRTEIYAIARREKKNCICNRCSNASSKQMESATDATRYEYRVSESMEDRY